MAPAGGGYNLQLGSFANLDNARKQAARLTALGYAPVIEKSDLGGKIVHRVMLKGVGDKKRKKKPVAVEAGKSYYFQAMGLKQMPEAKGVKKLEECRLIRTISFPPHQEDLPCTSCHRTSNSSTPKRATTTTASAAAPKTVAALPIPASRGPT